jgi:integrase/recombinase XerD
VDEYILPAGLSYSYQNQMISAVKKFYGKIYRSVMDPGELTRPRPQHRLPNVLSKDEVKKLIKWYEPQSKLWTQKTVQAPRN